MGPEGPGLLPDWIAVVIGLGVDKFLTMVISEEIAAIVVAIVGFGMTSDDETVPMLWLDTVLSFGFELFSFWLTLWLCRSRRLRAPAATAVLAWIVTLADRWFLNDYGYPMWYELGLLAIAPLAFGVLLVGVRRTLAQPSASGVR